MAHVKQISSTQLETLHDTKMEGLPLMNLVDNAGQSLWIPLIATHKEAIDKFAAFAEKPIDKETLHNCTSYSARIVGSGTVSRKFAAQEVHQFLSLEHHLLPESEAQAKRGIETALAHLNLPPVMPPDELKEKLPGLLASIQKTLTKQNETGSWLI